MMSEQWSESAQQGTRQMIEDMSFGSRNGKVFCKHIGGTFGYLDDATLLGGSYTVYSPDGSLIAEFESVDAMIASGWVLD